MFKIMPLFSVGLLLTDCTLSYQLKSFIKFKNLFLIPQCSNSPNWMFFNILSYDPIFRKIFFVDLIVYWTYFNNFFFVLSQNSEQKVATLEEEKKHLEFMNEMKKFDDSDSTNTAVSLWK